MYLVLNFLSHFWGSVQIFAPHLPRPINNLPTPTPPSTPIACYSTYEAPNMSAPATLQINRAEINRSNARNSTGPRTEAGKQRSSQNALRHGLTARTPVIPSEVPAAYQQHCRQFMDEYHPATPTETQMVQQLADTSWRINRIPLLEPDVCQVD